MFRRFSLNFALMSMGLDAILVVASLTTSSYIRPLLSELPFAAEVNRYTPVANLLYPLFAFSWVGIFLLLSVYDGRKNIYLVDEITSLTLGSILAGVALAGTLYITYREVSRLLFVIFVLLGYLSMLTWRMLARIAFRKLNGKGIQNRQVLIIGAGPVGKELQRKILDHPYLGLTPVGFLDDDPVKLSRDEDVMGSLAELRTLVSERRIDDVVIALPRRAYAEVNRLVMDLHSLPVKVWIIPDYFNLTLQNAVVENFAGLPMVDLRAPALNDYQRMVKRTFDIIVSIFLLPFILPIMGIIAIIIRLEGPGEIIFRQFRVGENGRLFKMLKFRTMVHGAEDLQYKVEKRDEQGNIIHKAKDDPRITNIGRFLRRTSFDELPQFFNILKGDMSLVGPRPELPYLVERYELWQRKRFTVPQGVTGWWQVSGRSERLMHLHTEDDLFYVQNYSLLLDLEILLKTIGVVLRGKGAF
jgi:exopolysaccharide biosynthesis polyprenyl glycosylphosphotransferase